MTIWRIFSFLKTKTPIEHLQATRIEELLRTSDDFQGLENKDFIDTNLSCNISTLFFLVLLILDFSDQDINEI